MPFSFNLEKHLKIIQENMLPVFDFFNRASLIKSGEWA